MLRSQAFNKATAYTGMLASILTLIDHICLLAAPAVSAILMPIGALVWLVWWVMVSVGLFKLAKARN